MNEPKLNAFAAVKSKKREHILAQMKEDVDAANESEVNGDA